MTQTARIYGDSMYELAAEENLTEQILEQMGYNESRYKMEYEVGQNVRVIDGPFENFIGIINEVSLDRGKMKVTISMFGRETPVELDFSQVEKV